MRRKPSTGHHRSISTVPHRRLSFANVVIIFFVSFVGIVTNNTQKKYHLTEAAMTRPLSLLFAGRLRSRRRRSPQHGRCFTTSPSSSAANTILVDGLATSHLGFDPLRNERHHPMVYHDGYSPPDWPEKHTFPMDKFRFTAHSILNDVDVDDDVDDDMTQPLVLSPHHFFRPLSFSTFPRRYLSPPIHPTFLASFLSGALSERHCRRIGFREQTRRPELIERTVLEVAGTVLTAQLAMKYGLASHLAGGTHHATNVEGRGFTILNDLAVVARLMTWREEDDEKSRDENDNPDDEDSHHPDDDDHPDDDNDNDNDIVMREFYRGEGNPVERVLVVDCDVHQGDGTASFHEKHHLHGRLFTLDLHAASNYPFAKAKCTYDRPLPDDCPDDLYLSTLDEALNLALEEVRPQLVLYNAGVDVHRSDKLGRLAISREGMMRRDRCVVSKCVEGGIPVAVVVGGGYDEDVRELGRRHALVHRVCGQIWRQNELWRRR
ncbi:hypothetical protein ACHAXS_008050 [Conticribra weissflogii]